MTPTTVPAYQLRITLLGIDPPIWRTVQVPAHVTLYLLHRVIQVAMGWGDDHLHEFRAGKKQYGTPMPGGHVRIHDETETRLYRVLTKPRQRMLYEYDFGDCWKHEVVLEEVIRGGAPLEHPVCVAGERACPPEDCGGVWGYQDLLEAVADPEHPDHEDRMDWLGDAFDPEAFDRDAVNRRLQEMTGTE
jgi:hypothetical protein